MVEALVLVLGLALVVGVFALPICAWRRHNRIYPKGRERIGDPDAAQATRRFETIWTFFSGRGGPGP
jgi:hypothetical protein